MNATPRRRSIGPVLITALAYIVIGIVTAYSANSAGSTQSRNVWRLAGWLLSLVAFASHVGYERLRLGESARRAAGDVAFAVALAAFVLAAVGPVRSHWGGADFGRAALALGLWPLLTGGPAFLAALIVGAVLRPQARE